MSNYYSQLTNSLLNYLLAGEELGHPADLHINYLDKSKSSPLHLAVRGGNIEAIRFCIANGGKIHEQQVLTSQNQKKNKSLRWFIWLSPQFFLTSVQRFVINGSYRLQILQLIFHPSISFFSDLHCFFLYQSSFAYTCDAGKGSVLSLYC